MAKNELLYACQGPCEMVYDRNQITVTRDGRWMCDECFEALPEEEKGGDTGRPPKMIPVAEAE